MLPYSSKCSKNTENKYPKVVKTKKRRIMLSSNCSVCSSKISRFIKKQEAKRLLNMIGKIPLIGQSLM